MIEIKHINCGGVAFMYEGKPEQGRALDPEKATLLDGTSPKMYEPIVCGSCGALADIEDLYHDIDDRDMWKKFRKEKAMRLLLQTAKAILHEVDGTTGGYDPNSYIPPHLVQALSAAIEEEQRKQTIDQQNIEMNNQLNPIFRAILNTTVRR
jgi:hypothetical protein